MRWALEEAGYAYTIRPVSFPKLKQPAHLARHPFGQTPAYEAGDLVKFPDIAAYVTRAEARPAFQRAFEAQRAFNQQP